MNDINLNKLFKKYEIIKLYKNEIIDENIFIKGSIWTYEITNINYIKLFQYLINSKEKNFIESFQTYLNILYTNSLNKLSFLFSMIISLELYSKKSLFLSFIKFLLTKYNYNDIYFFKNLLKINKIIKFENKIDIMSYHKNWDSILINIETLNYILKVLYNYNESKIIKINLIIKKIIIKNRVTINNNKIKYELDQISLSMFILILFELKNYTSDQKKENSEILKKIQFYKNMINLSYCFNKKFDFYFKKLHWIENEVFEPNYRSNYYKNISIFKIKNLIKKYKIDNNYDYYYNNIDLILKNLILKNRTNNLKNISENFNSFFSLNDNLIKNNKIKNFDIYLKSLKNNKINKLKDIYDVNFIPCKNNIILKDCINNFNQCTKIENIWRKENLINDNILLEDLQKINNVIKNLSIKYKIKTYKDKIVFIDEIENKLKNSKNLVKNYFLQILNLYPKDSKIKDYKILNKIFFENLLGFIENLNEDYGNILNSLKFKIIKLISNNIFNDISKISENNMFNLKKSALLLNTNNIFFENLMKNMDKLNGLNLGEIKINSINKLNKCIQILSIKKNKNLNKKNNKLDYIEKLYKKCLEEKKNITNNNSENPEIEEIKVNSFEKSTNMLYEKNFLNPSFNKFDNRNNLNSVNKIKKLIEEDEIKEKKGKSKKFRRKKLKKKESQENELENKNWQVSYKEVSKEDNSISDNENNIEIDNIIEENLFNGEQDLKVNNEKEKINIIKSKNFSKNTKNKFLYDSNKTYTLNDSYTLNYINSSKNKNNDSLNDSKLDNESKFGSGLSNRNNEENQIRKYSIAYLKKKTTFKSLKEFSNMDISNSEMSKFSNEDNDNNDNEKGKEEVNKKISKEEKSLKNDIIIINNTDNNNNLNNKTSSLKNKANKNPKNSNKKVSIFKKMNSHSPFNNNEKNQDKIIEEKEDSINSEANNSKKDSILSYSEFRNRIKTIKSRKVKNSGNIMDSNSIQNKNDNDNNEKNEKIKLLEDLLNNKNKLIDAFKEQNGKKKMLVHNRTYDDNISTILDNYEDNKNKKGKGKRKKVIRNVKKVFSKIFKKKHI